MTSYCVLSDSNLRNIYGASQHILTVTLIDVYHVLTLFRPSLEYLLKPLLYSQSRPQRVPAEGVSKSTVQPSQREKITWP